MVLAQGGNGCRACAQAVVTGVLLAAGKRGAVGADRAHDEASSRRLLGVPGGPDRRGDERLEVAGVHPGPLQGQRGELVGRRRRDVRAGVEECRVRPGDRGRVRPQRGRGPQGGGQVLAVPLEQGGQTSVEDEGAVDRQRHREAFRAR